MADGSLKRLGSFSLACFFAAAYGPAIERGDGESEASTSMQGSLSDDASAGPTQTCIAGECAAEFSATRACAGTEPAFICSDETRPETAGCEVQYDALYACMGL